jgi:hypothetical protein
MINEKKTYLILNGNSPGSAVGIPLSSVGGGPGGKLLLGGGMASRSCS